MSLYDQDGPDWSGRGCLALVVLGTAAWVPVAAAGYIVYRWVSS